MRRLVLLVISLALSAWPATADGWQAVNAPDLGFSALFPVKPHVSEDTADLGDGQKAKTSVYQIIATNTIYDVTVAEYPKGMLAPIGEEQVLDNARDGAVANAPGPLLGETKMEFAGRPARELKVDMSMNLVATNRIFVVGDRLYSVGAVTNKDRTNSPDIAKFFASFKLEGASKP